MAEYTLFEKVRIVIPDCFREMTSDEVQSYYNNPAIKTSFIYEEKKATIAAFIGQDKEDMPALENRLAGYRKLYSRMTPGYSQGEMLKRTQNGMDICALTFKSNAIDKDVYNVLLIFDAGLQEVSVMMNCSFKDCATLIPMFSTISGSIAIRSE